MEININSNNGQSNGSSPAGENGSFFRHVANLIWASLIFFTRLPLWRIYQPPKECYSRVVEFWPLTGWITGGCMACVIYFGGMIFPYPTTVILAILTRVLITGALHEDGLADFCDGFGGGGNNRQRILDIMKDSHIGTYGVLGLIIYAILLWSCLSCMPVNIAALTVFAADPYSKMIAGQIIQMMPYARNEETSKSHTVYRKFSVKSGITLFIQGTLPLIPLLYCFGDTIRWNMIIFIPCIVFYFLYLMIWKKLRGYTGDCCGALFLVTELSFYIVVASTLY